MFNTNFAKCDIELGDDDMEPDTLLCTIIENAIPRLRPEQRTISFRGVRDVCVSDWHMCVLWEDDLSRVDCMGFEFRQTGAQQFPLTALSRNKMPLGINAPHMEKPYGTLRMYDGYNLAFDGFRFPITSRFPGKDITKIACFDPPRTLFWFDNSTSHPSLAFGAHLNDFYTPASTFIISIILSFLYTFALMILVKRISTCKNNKLAQWFCCCCLSRESAFGWGLMACLGGILGAILTVFILPNTYFKVLWFAAGSATGAAAGYLCACAVSRAAFKTVDEDIVLGHSHSIGSDNSSDDSASQGSNESHSSEPMIDQTYEETTYKLHSP